MSIPTLLRSGMTCAVLEPVGKVPSEKVRFVNLAMIAAKAPPHFLSIKDYILTNNYILLDFKICNNDITPYIRQYFY